MTAEYRTRTIKSAAFELQPSTAAALAAPISFSYRQIISDAISPTIVPLKYAGLHTFDCDNDF